MKTILILLVLLFSLSNIEAKDKVKRTAKIERCIEKHKKQVCSFKRSKRNELEIAGKKYSNSLDQFNIDNQDQVLCIKGKDKILLNPIINLSERDVWGFIKGNNIEYCKLYDEGYKRIGCIFCPMAPAKTKKLDRKKYPGIEREIKKSIEFIYQNGSYKNFKSVDDIFDWWISNNSTRQYFLDKQQTELF